MGKKKLNKAQIGTVLKPITAENVSDFFSLFSIPQKAITKLITGKYQAPSEAMGINNKAGAIATDIILDPVNLIGGAGAVKATGAYKNAYKYNPWRFKPNPEAYYRGVGKGGYQDAMNRSFLGNPKGSRWDGHLYMTDDLKHAEHFSDGYIAEIPKREVTEYVSNPTTRNNPNVFAAENKIPTANVKFYKQDWLRGYKEIKPPKKKENGGWLDKYDAPKAQNGIEGTMGGLTDQGFDYNGAWGGTMQMGGNLPGSVGFMYARTQNPAPSNGPYAKKTKASAQNGMEMKFYQEGLDWKPKNISQDGTYVKKPRTDMSTMDEYRLQKALAEQPVIQSPKGKQLSKEEINKRNKEYAQQTGKKFDEKTGKVSSRFSPQEEKTLDRITENIVMPALAVGDVMGGMAIGAPLIKGAGKAALKKLPTTLKKLPTIPRAPMPSPKGGMIMGQPVRPSTTMFGMSTEEFDRTVAELAARDRLNPADPSVRVRTLSEFDSRMEDYARANQIDLNDAPSGIVERFSDIAQQYGLDMTDPFRGDAIRSLSEENKKAFLTSFYQAIPSRLRRSDFVPRTSTSSTRQIKNRSGLTKEQALQKASEKDKDVVSKMTEDEFINTVVKPTGEVAPFYSGDVMSKFADKQAITKLPVEEYVNTFNANINVLNDIIAKRNKSGVDYAVKELDPYGKLTFTSPVGESSWSLGINPGKWEGDVEDIASPYYLKSIPGLEMRNTTAGVFADRTPRRGTGTYESINEYLKQIGLGRVKPGFNSQTVYSRGLWEDAVKKGKAVGYYNDPSTVYGSMKGLLPYAGLGALGAGAIEQKKKGGEIKKDDMGYWNPENWGEPVEIDSNQITMEGVYEPLIGISDTGDVQYMEPGGEYEFDGESVIEYPIAQSGKTLPTVNVKKEPIYVDDPNDPRLRAYQDSLNLYNKGLRPFLNFGDYEDGDERKYNKSDYKPTKNWGKTKVKKSDIVSDIKAIKDELNWQESKNTRKNLKDRLALLNQSLQTGIYPTNMVYPETYSAALIFKKPVQPVQYKKAEPKKEQPVKKEQPKPVERKQNMYEGSPVYSPGIGSGLPSALIGFANQKGDTTYIKPEDYERFAVPKYAKEYIETKKQKNGGWLDKYN